jgi:hypothetical protein
MPRIAPHAALLLAACTSLLLSCADCDRSGCERLGELATQGDTGVSGVVAAQSDLVTDGCQECPMGEATLTIWRVDTAVTDAAAAAATVAQREPDVTENVSGQYSRALEAGPHLLCVRPRCIGLTITTGETLTVNVKRLDGPVSFFVGAPGVANLRESPGLEVGY